MSFFSSIGKNIKSFLFKKFFDKIFLDFATRKINPYLEKELIFNEDIKVKSLQQDIIETFYSTPRMLFANYKKKLSLVKKQTLGSEEHNKKVKSLQKETRIKIESVCAPALPDHGIIIDKYKERLAQTKKQSIEAYKALLDSRKYIVTNHKRVPLTKKNKGKILAKKEEALNKLYKNEHEGFNINSKTQALSHLFLINTLLKIQPKKHDDLAIKRTDATTSLMNFKTDSLNNIKESRTFDLKFYHFLSIFPCYRPKCDEIKETRDAVPQLLTM